MTMKMQALRWVAGIGALVVAGWAGVHVAHLLDEGDGQHGGELGVLAVVAVVLLVVSRRSVSTPQKPDA